MDNQISNQRGETLGVGDGTISRVAAESAELLAKATTPLELARTPDKQDRSIPQLSLASPDGSNIGKEHKVKSGDSLWKISENSLKEQKQGSQPRDIQAMVDAIVKANKDKYPQLEKNPHMLKRDMTLLIPNAKQEQKQAVKVEKAPDVFDQHQGPSRKMEKQPGRPAQTDKQPDLPVGGKVKPAPEPGENPAAMKKPANPEHPPSEKIPLPRPRPTEADRVPLPRRKPEQPQENVPVPLPKPEQKDKVEPELRQEDWKSRTHVQHESFQGKEAVASWYDEGRKTANGEKFYPDGLTAAHKSMPFGTLLEVFYPRTKQAVEVRVNDRGPFIEGRDIDLSRGAARKLGMMDDGVGPVKYRIILWGKGS